MERRELLTTAAAAVLGALSGSALAADHDHHHDHGSAPRHAALIATTGDCLQRGEACLAHCLVLLGKGDKEMAPCAQSVNQMLAVCGALARLAAQDAPATTALAQVAADVCADCEKECRKHEKKHAECKACAEACAACLKECRKLAA